MLTARSSPSQQITNLANFALWKEHPIDLADRRAWFDTLVAQDRPRIAAVHVESGRCVGYAALQTFMANYGFRRCASHLPSCGGGSVGHLRECGRRH